MKKDAPIYIRVTGDDYDRLLNALDALNYHWISGQHAADPPAFLDTVGQNVTGIRVVNPSSQIIG